MSASGEEGSLLVIPRWSARCDRHSTNSTSPFSPRAPPPARRERNTPVPQGRFIDLGRSDITGAPNAFNYNTLLPNKSDLSLPRTRQLWRIAFNSRDPDIFYDRIMHYSLFLSFLYLAQSLRATGGCYTQCSPRNISRLSVGIRHCVCICVCVCECECRSTGDATFVCTLGSADAITAASVPRIYVRVYRIDGDNTRDAPRLLNVSRGRRSRNHRRPCRSGVMSTAALSWPGVKCVGVRSWLAASRSRWIIMHWHLTWVVRVPRRTTSWHAVICRCAAGRPPDPFLHHH